MYQGQNHASDSNIYQNFNVYGGGPIYHNNPAQQPCHRVPYENGALQPSSDSQQHHMQQLEKLPPSYPGNLFDQNLVAKPQQRPRLPLPNQFPNQDVDSSQLFQERQQLLQECKVYLCYASDPKQAQMLQNKVERLEQDLMQSLTEPTEPSNSRNLMTVSNALEVERNEVINKMRQILGTMIQLETELRSLSTSMTLSMSSSSSLGSLSSHDSESSSALCLEDLYTNVAHSEELVQSVANLQKKVEQHISGNSNNERQYTDRLRLIEAAEDRIGSCSNIVRVLSMSTLSLSPRSSLSSLSTPPPTAVDCNPRFVGNMSYNESSVLLHSESFSASHDNTSANASQSILLNFLPNESDELGCDDELKILNQKLKESGLLSMTSSNNYGSSMSLFTSSEAYILANEKSEGNAINHLHSMPNLSQFSEAGLMKDENVFHENTSSVHTTETKRLLQEILNLNMAAGGCENQQGWSTIHSTIFQYVTLDIGTRNISSIGRMSNSISLI